MKCTPGYHGEPRIDVGSRSCDNTCFHWDACLKELNLKPNWENKFWIETDATEEDLINETFHKRTFNNGYSKKHSKYEEFSVNKKWHILAKT